MTLDFPTVRFLQKLTSTAVADLEPSSLSLLTAGELPARQRRDVPTRERGTKRGAMRRLSSGNVAVCLSRSFGTHG
jgi:hypothetical protein